MADDKEKRPGYSVDEILAEYGSGKYDKKSNVVDFPDLRASRPSTAPGASRRPAAPVELKRPAAPPEEAGPDRRRPVQEVPPQNEGEDLPEPPTPIPEPEKPASRAPAGKRVAKAEPVTEIVPDGFRRTIGAKVSAWRRRAEHFADHMYEEAEPSEEDRKAERYLPGVDQEEEPPEEKGRLNWFKFHPAPRPEELPPDVPPGQLATRFRRGLLSQGRRVLISGVVAFLTLLVSLDLPFLNWTELAQGFAEGALTPFQLRSILLTVLLAVVGALCYDVPANAIRLAASLKAGPETVAALAWLFTLIDGLTAGRLEDRGNCLPCSAVTAVGLVCALWGIHSKQAADRVSAKAASQVRSPYIVTLDENKWNSKPAYTKRSDPPAGFGSQLLAEDGPSRIYRLASPLLLLGGVLCALLASVGRGNPGRFPWAASCCFTAAAAWSALLVYGLPYRKLADRLNKVGAALAGWPGVLRCGPAGIIMTDTDLFPTGSISVTQVNVFGGAATEKVVAYTATLLRVLDCGLTRPFHDLLRSQGAIYREVSGVVAHEGGVSGIIRNQEVLVGTGDFMRMMDVPLPPGHNIRNAVYCAVDGQLRGLFPLKYTMNPAVKPSLAALIRERISPILATRDPVVIPAMLEQKFHLPVDKLEFPSSERRQELSGRDQDHDPTAVAILSREGLAAYCDAVLGGRRLQMAAKWGMLFALACSVLGLVVTLYLTSVGAFASLTTVNFLVFMAAWLVPELVISNWVNQY